MATYYWVGGSGNWDATTTTNWASSSGGAGGAGVPTSADDVIFDANSNVTTGAFTVTVTGDSTTPAVCRDFSTGGAGGALDGAMTLALGSTGFLDCYGSMTIPASNLSVTSASGAEIGFRATTTGKTLTTNGVSIGTNIVLRFNGAGGAWSLGGALTLGGTTGTIALATGTFDTSNFNITLGAINISGSSTRTFTLGSSTVTLSGNSAIVASTTTNLTFNAGTSTISCSATSPTFAGGGLTFYNVSFTSNAAGTATITGDNTFNNLTFTSRAADGIRSVIFGGSQTVSGTLTLGAANTAVRRILVYSSTFHTQRTLTVATVATLSDVDFKDIVAAGASGTWSGTRLGNGLNNSNITFGAGKTVYWNLVAGGNWSSVAWATSSGGAVDVNNFPLAQDTCIIENTGLNTSATITLNNAWWIGTLDISSRTNAMTLAQNGNTWIYKDIIFSSAVTQTGNNAWNLTGYSAVQNITTAGVTITSYFIDYNPSGIKLIDNYTSNNTTAHRLDFGTLDLNDKTLTCAAFSSSNSNTRAIAFGTGNITVTGNAAQVWNMQTATNFTYTGTPTVNATYSGSTGTRLIYHGSSGGSSPANAISVNVSAGSDTVTLNYEFKNIDFTGFTGTLSNTIRGISGNVKFVSGMTLTAGAVATTFSGTSGTQQVITNGQTLDFPITQNGIGGTVQLQDALTMGSTRAYTLTNGTLNVNSKTLTTGAFSSSNSNARTVAMGTNGNITVNGGNWTATTSTNLSLTGTGTIDMTYGSSKTFAGGDKTYPYTLNQGGSGTLTITGANTFANISNTVQPATITFPAATTTSVQNFTVSGTAGNLVTLNSSTPGTQWTIAKV